MDSFLRGIYLGVEFLGHGKCTCSAQWICQKGFRRCPCPAAGREPAQALSPVLGAFCPVPGSPPAGVFCFTVTVVLTCEPPRTPAAGHLHARRSVSSLVTRLFPRVALFWGDACLLVARWAFPIELGGKWRGRYLGSPRGESWGGVGRGLLAGCGARGRQNWVERGVW